MTKKQNRRYIVRRVRRALKRGASVGSKITGRRMYVDRYGQGITRSRSFHAIEE